VDPVSSESLLIVWHPPSGSAASTRGLAPATSRRLERLPAPSVDFIMHNSRKQTQFDVTAIIFADLPQQTINYNCAAPHRENLCTFGSIGLVSAAIPLGSLP